VRKVKIQFSSSNFYYDSKDSMESLQWDFMEQMNSKHKLYAVHENGKYHVINLERVELVTISDRNGMECIHE